MADEKVNFKLGLDDTGFNTGMTSMRSQVASLAGSSGKLTDSLGKAATATSGLAGAMGGASGKAAAFLGAADNLAQAFLIGGPLALGIAGVATGLGLMSRASDDAKKRADELTVTLRENLKKELDGVAQKADDAARAVREFGMAPVEVEAARSFAELTANIDRQAQVREELAAVEARHKEVKNELIAVIGAENELRSGNAELNAKDRGDLQEMKVLLKEEKEAIEAKNEAGLTQVDVLKQELVALQLKEPHLKRELASRRQLIELVETETNSRNKNTSTVKKEAKSYEDASAHVEEYIRHLQELADIERDASPLKNAFEDFDKAQRRKIDATRKSEAEMVRIAERAAEEKAAAYRAAADAMTSTQMSMAEGFTGAALGAADELITGLIEGQEYALETAAANFLRSIGGQLVGIGTKAMFEGAIISANPLTPGAGAPMFALGAAAVAAGIGMGAAGTALGAAVSNAQAGPADKTSSLGLGGSNSVSSGGVNRSSSTSTGPQQETVIYQFNAPVFGDHNEAAREVHRLQRRARNQLLEAG